MSPVNNKVILHLTSLSSGGGYTFTIDVHRACVGYGYESYVVIRGKKCIFPDGSQKELRSNEHLYWNKMRRFVFRQVVKHSQIDNGYSMYNLCERFTCHSAKDILAALPKKPDVIFVHWVSDFTNAEVIRDLEALTGARILFLLVDHAMFSGGCHYQLDCQGYKDGCHDCPATNSKWIKRGIEKNYLFKQQFLPKDIIVSARGSEKQRLRQSAIYGNCRIESVAFPIDENKFCPPADRALLRSKWNIPTDRKLVLIGASHLDEKRKGMALLIESLAKVKCDVTVLVVGYMKSRMTFGKDSIILGFLDESRLIEAYQMADVFVCSSLADAGPMMVKQCCLCGTPVVAFPVGESVGLVRNGETGYLAKYGDVDDMAHGIDAIVSLSDENWHEMSLRCRERAVELFSSKVGNTIEDFMGKEFGE